MGGRVARYSLESSVAGSSVVVADIVGGEVEREGVGPREMDMTCSTPERRIPSEGSPSKKSRRMDLSWMNRGWVSNSSEAK
jgi:hypothetical protein